MPVIPTRSAPSRSKWSISAAVSSRDPALPGTPESLTATPAIPAALMSNLTQGTIVRFGEIDMHDRTVLPLVIGAFPAPGVIDDLVRNDDIAGLQVGPDAADRRDGNNGFGAALAQGPDIRPIIDLVRSNGVPVSVPGQKCHRAAANLSKRYSARGSP